jgi:uncharacterized protein (TIGR04255 family)
MWTVPVLCEYGNRYAFRCASRYGLYCTFRCMSLEGCDVYERREVFEHAPLALVAAELRFAYSPRLSQQRTLDAIAIAMEDLLPVVRPGQQTVMSPGVPPKTGSTLQLFNLSSTVSLTLTPTNVILEATEYDEFGNFSDVFSLACASIDTARGISVLERIGLRYVDEIRVPGPIDDARDWRGWVADPLLSMLDFNARPVRTHQGVIEYSLGSNRYLALRFAAVIGDPVVGGGPLKRPSQPGPGPQFVLDVDCYWQPPSDEPTRFSRAFVESELKALHDPTGDAFQNAITDRTRKLFRGN